MATAKRAVRVAPSRVEVAELAAAVIAAAPKPEEKVLISAKHLADGNDWKQWEGKVLVAETQVGISAHSISKGYEFIIKKVHPAEITRDRYFVVDTLDPKSAGFLDRKDVPADQMFSVTDRAKLTLPLKTPSHYSAAFSKYRKAYTMGSDPEIFAVDAGGSLIPAFEYLGPSTHRQYMVGAAGAEAYWDGYQAEFSHAPASCINYLADYIQLGLSQVQDALNGRVKGGRLSLRSAFEVPPQRLVEDEDQYVSFGCMPSLSVYGDKPPAFEPRLIPFRTAGGHLHFGGHIVDIPAAVKALDRVLGVISVSLFQHWENPQRRLLYGKAGEYRKTKVGFEYRVLSNSWLCHPMMVHLVFELSRRAFATLDPDVGDRLWDVTEEEARKCINTSDVKMARQLLERNKNAFLGLLESLPGVGIYNRVPVMEDMVLNGVHRYLTNPDFPSKHWGLADGQDFGYRTYSGGPAGRLSSGMRTLTIGGKLD